MAMSALAVPAPYLEAIERQWALLASAGTWWTGEERVAIAAEARGARTGNMPSRTPLRDMAAEACHRIASDTYTVDQAWVDSVLTRGLRPEAMIELTSLVARTAAVDTFLFGLGADEKALPLAKEGNPTLMKVQGVSSNGAWLPTAGPASALNALSAVTAEQRSFDELQAAFYLTPDQVRDLDADRQLSRPQLELVAARSSMLNDCYYLLFAHAGLLKAAAAKLDQPINLRALRDHSTDVELPGGAELLRLTDAVVLRDPYEMPDARAAAVEALGVPSTVRAIATAASFQMMDRVFDVIGLASPPAAGAIAEELGIEWSPG